VCDGRKINNYLHHETIGSGDGTNLNMGTETLFRRSLNFFVSTSTINRFGERFRDGLYIQFGQFLVCCSTHGAPCPAICKSGGGHLPPCPME